MIKSTDLTALIDRVSTATGADRELDAVIFILFPSLTDGKPPFNVESDPWHLQWTRPAYTSSLDAVIALVERHDPHQTQPWSVRQVLGANWYVASIEGDEDVDCGDGEGKTPALALLLAFLRSKSTPAKEA